MVVRCCGQSASSTELLSACPCVVCGHKVPGSLDFLSDLLQGMANPDYVSFGPDKAEDLTAVQHHLVHRRLKQVHEVLVNATYLYTVGIVDDVTNAMAGTQPGHGHNIVCSTGVKQLVVVTIPSTFSAPSSDTLASRPSTSVQS